MLSTTFGLRQREFRAALVLLVPRGMAEADPALGVDPNRRPRERVAAALLAELTLHLVGEFATATPLVSAV